MSPELALIILAVLALLVLAGLWYLDRTGRLEP